MNTTQRIRDEDDLMDLKKEFRNSSLPELLLESHDLNRKEGLKFCVLFITLIIQFLIRKDFHNLKRCLSSICGLANSFKKGTVPMGLWR